MQLEKISAFRSELAIAETIEEIKHLDTKASALAEIARKERVGKSTQDEVGAFRCDIEAKKGAWLDEYFPQGGDRKSNSNLSSLKDHKIKFDESSNARLVNKEQELVAEAIEEIKKDDKKVVTPSAVSSLVRNKKRKIRVEETEQPNLDGIYRVIYADPPWQYNADFMDKYGHAKSHYSTMSIEELCALPVADVRADDCVLFMWTTSPKLEQAFQVIKAWGFKYKTSFVWDKVKHNFGYYNSVRHEFLLIAGHGSSTPDVKELHDSVISIERSGKHSEKPEYFRELIDKLYTTGNKVELFARNKVEGWDTWGAEV
jgi:N6-adenosine-specific RNA methylase IME4|tara:strand:+ start:238 stop:1182 length:945 start_codon:yes stop_codon:yes gene_type:complete